jgi:hypothetical protein
MATCRWRTNGGVRAFALCRDCLDAPLRSFVWIVPGQVPCFGLCRGCSRWFPVSELAELVPAGGKWSAPGGLCVGCVEGRA